MANIIFSVQQNTRLLEVNNLDKKFLPCMSTMYAYYIQNANHNMEITHDYKINTAGCCNCLDSRIFALPHQQPNPQVVSKPQEPKG